MPHHLLKPKKVEKVNPKKKFKGSSGILDNHTINDFWQWAFSDLMQNTTRGVLAEYIIAAILGIDDKPRNPWTAYDLKLQDGRTIEIKTMSKLQAWTQKKLSDPMVVLKPTRDWDPETGKMEEIPTLTADIYIFCFFITEDHDIADPMDLNQWKFFILDKETIFDILKDRKSISLKLLDKLNIKAHNADEVFNLINL